MYYNVYMCCDIKIVCVLYYHVCFVVVYVYGIIAPVQKNDSF